MNPSTPLPISLFIIALNEADRLGATLHAVAGLCDEVIVVDSGSTDGTVALAQSLGARVINRTFDGYGPQKRFAEEQCRNDWLLNLDADEVMPADLVQEIRALFSSGAPPCDAYTLRIAEVFHGEGAPHPWAYALAPVRLYRKSVGHYVSSTVHDRVALSPQAKVGALKGTIHHFSVRSLGDQLRKLNDYSQMQADDLVARGIAPSRLRLFTEFPLAFVKAYVLRRHAVRGRFGVMTAMNFAFYRYLRIAKHWEAWQMSDNKPKE